jgi:hypothetical protein
MMKSHDRSFAHAETALTRTVEDAGGDRDAVIEGVAVVMAQDLRQSGRAGTGLLSAISALADAAARAAVASGGEMGCIAQGFLIGVMLATEHGNDSLLAVIAHAAGTFVKHAYAAGADAVSAASGLAEGAAAWAGERGLNSGAAASAAGQGAADAAEEVSPSVGRKVRERLTSGLISGVAVMLRKPVTSSSQMVYPEPVGQEPAPRL